MSSMLGVAIPTIAQEIPHWTWLTSLETSTPRIVRIQFRGFIALFPSLMLELLVATYRWYSMLPGRANMPASIARV